MSRKPEKRYWRIVGFGLHGTFLARYAAGAVAGFRRRFGTRLAQRKLAIKTDHETGGWKGISVAAYKVPRPDRGRLLPFVIRPPNHLTT